jgi:hypothetical protein
MFYCRNSDSRSWISAREEKLYFPRWCSLSSSARPCFAIVSCSLSPVQRDVRLFPSLPVCLVMGIKKDMDTDGAGGKNIPMLIVSGDDPGLRPTFRRRPAGRLGILSTLQTLPCIASAFRRKIAPGTHGIPSFSGIIASFASGSSFCQDFSDGGWDQGGCISRRSLSSD